MKPTTKMLRANLNIETLEDRLALSLTSATLSGGMLYLNGDNNASNITLSQSGSNIVAYDSTNGFSRSFAASAVQRAQFVGGASADRLVNNVALLPVQAWGYGGNDYLEGYNGADYFVGGDGDDTLVGYGGDDQMWGGNGNDVLRGMIGNDSLVGDAGNDRLNGGAGTDQMWGGAGSDVLIALDGGTSDFVQGDADRDIIWTDLNGSVRDGVAGLESGDKLQAVAAFSNGADRTLDGDRIADPTLKAGASYRRFANNPLFSSSGPSINDIRQGNLGDCWLLSGLGGIALDNPFALRQNVVDFDDGTYGVRLGSKFYRVDDDLASTSSGSPAYAKLGAQNSMWVAVVEKAYAHYRTGANSFVSLEGGWSVDVNKAFGATSTGNNAFSSYANATALANEIFSRWNTYGAVTVGFVDGRYGKYIPGVDLINNHMYTVFSVTRVNGVVTAITLRNPWGIDTDSASGARDGNNNGYVTVTPSQLFALVGRVNWGAV